MQAKRNRTRGCIMELILLMLVGVIFFGILIFSRQSKWFLRVLRNSFCGICGMFFLNFALASYGLSIGINALTVIIVGLLGAPGFLLLYAALLLA